MEEITKQGVPAQEIPRIVKRLNELEVYFHCGGFCEINNDMYLFNDINIGPTATYESCFAMLKDYLSEST